MSSLQQSCGASAAVTRQQTAATTRVGTTAAGSRAVSGSRLVAALTPLAQSVSRQPTAAASVRATPAAASVRATAASTRVTPVAQTAFSQLRVSPAAASVRASRQTAAGLSRSATAGAGLNKYTSQVEQAVVSAERPLDFANAREQVQVGQYKGVQLNREEEQQFRGNLAEYKISEDSNPEVLRKRLEKVKYVKEVALKCLKPPTPAPAGDLIIREKRSQVPAAPPVVLRQAPCPVRTPTPAVFREAPPKTPTPIPEQVVEVDGAPVPPPARRVVLEKLAPAPAKPQNVLIERWLPYKPQTRRVVFEPSDAQPEQNPRNLIIEWEQAEAEVEQVCKDLGVEAANPEEYRRQYGAELKNASEIPALCPDHSCGQARLPTPPCQQAASPACGPCGTPVRAATGAASVRAATVQRSASAAAQGGLNLVGDLAALKLVDLDRYGLGEYRRFVQ